MDWKYVRHPVVTFDPFAIPCAGRSIVFGRAESRYSSGVPPHDAVPHQYVAKVIVRDVHEGRCETAD